MSQVKPEIVNRRIEWFEKRFGKAHLYLAYHAAFPLALTPDLLYSLWANFQRDIHSELLDIPWIAVADVLLSSLCEEVGNELYEMDLAVRNQLLRQLKADERFGQSRIDELSDFLLDYIQQQFLSDDLDAEFFESQRWVALAYTRPQQAARELALAFTKLDVRNQAEIVRLASLTATITEPLAEFQPLLIYARGMAKFARGNLAEAKAQFKQLNTGGKQIQIAGVKLPIPGGKGKSFFNRLTRRELIELAALGTTGLLMAVIFRSIEENSRFRTFQFETVTVDARGNIIDRRNREAKYFVEDLSNGVTLEMVQIPGGTFLMGSPISEAGRSADESPLHQVTVSDFLMGKYEVTQAQYQAIMGTNPANFKGEQRPVEQVSWNDSVEFCKRLSQRTGKTYRLPSEAEWEYACRARTTTPFYFGETITTALVNYDGRASYASAPRGEFRQQTTTVGSFPPNAFGLYDMHGNVWEWCQDHWHDNYNGALTDGSAWLNANDNQSRLLRGGSWYNDPANCRSALRYRFVADNRDDDIGFRVVLDSA